MCGKEEFSLKKRSENSEYYYPTGGTEKNSHQSSRQTSLKSTRVSRVRLKDKSAYNGRFEGFRGQKGNTLASGFTIENGIFEK